MHVDSKQQQLERKRQSHTGVRQPEHLGPKLTGDRDTHKRSENHRRPPHHNAGFEQLYREPDL